jgi:hypothetical protein
MEAIHISTLSETLQDGHPETRVSYHKYDCVIEQKTYIDEWSNQMYLVTRNKSNSDILNIQTVEQ